MPDNENQQVIDPVLQALVFNEPIPQAAPEPTNQPTPDATPAAAEPTPDNDVVATDVFIKEHFGIDNYDTFKAEWENYQKIKTTPAPKAEHAFANDESKRIYAAITQGKTKEVRAYLEAQENLSTLDTMTDEQKLKMFIRMQNPLFDSELIDDEFVTQFAVDESKYKDDNGTIIDPLGLRKEKLRADQRRMNEVQKANDYFAQYKSKIELPEIQQTQPVVDQDYETYKASIAEDSKFIETIIAPALGSMKDTDINFNFNVTDQNNQMQFDVALAAEKEDFEKARTEALNYLKYISENFYDKDGKFLPDQVVQSICSNRTLASMHKVLRGRR